jgi:hypothetical protein
MTNLRTLLLTLTALAIFPGAIARADSLAITFDHSILSAAPGETVTFSGTVTNLENAIVDLNSCGVNLTGPFTSDFCSLFLSNAPFFLNPHETSGPFDMFAVTVDLPFTGPFGVQSPGIFTVLGGPDGDAQEVLARADFGVIVAPEIAAPEPGSFMLLGLAVTLSFVLWRGKRLPTG